MGSVSKDKLNTVNLVRFWWFNKLFIWYKFRIKFQHFKFKFKFEFRISVVESVHNYRSVTLTEKKVLMANHFRLKSISRQKELKTNFSTLLRERDFPKLEKKLLNETVFSLYDVKYLSVWWIKFIKYCNAKNKCCKKREKWSLSTEGVGRERQANKKCFKFLSPTHVQKNLIPQVLTGENTNKTFSAFKYNLPTNI